MTQFSLPDYCNRVDTRQKIIKEADYRMLSEVQYSLSDLERQLQELQERNEAIFEQQKAAGYEAGLNQAKTEQAEQLFVAATEIISYISSVEQTMVKIVFDTIRRIFSDFEDVDIVAHLVQKSLQQFRDRSRVKLYVTPDNARLLRDKLEQTLAPVADLSLLDIVESPQVDKRGCRLESEMGSVEADLESLLQMMESAINVHFAEH